MGTPRLHSPAWGSSGRTVHLHDASREQWLRAARRTHEELWAQAQSNRTPAPTSVSLMADAAPATPSADGAGADVERPHRVARPAATVPKSRTPRREQRANCPHCGGDLRITLPDPAARYVRRPLAPPRVRVLSFLQQRRDATATLRTLMRRLHLKKAEILAVLNELQRAGLGRIHRHRWRPAFAHRCYEAQAFTLTACGRDPAVLLF
jgi:hypothetical protein